MSGHEKVTDNRKDVGYEQHTPPHYLGVGRGNDLAIVMLAILF